MPKKIDQIKIRLLQARTSPIILVQEQTCFMERLGIRSEQILATNVVDQPLSLKLLEEVDALMIGGSGEFPAMDEYHWMPMLLEMIQYCNEHSFPLFGSCWGHQVIARALGGRVEHVPALAELGCFDVMLTDEGINDPVLGQFPKQFAANMGHHDRVVELPSSAIELAISRTQGHQVFRIKDKPIYGTQFHSELDSQREKERLYEYREHYKKTIGDATQFQKILDSLRETTEVDQLMRTFVNVYCLNNSN
jgi:GMP synthase (glutamine-hydrolysing)